MIVRVAAIAWSVVSDAARRKVLYAVLAAAAVMTFAIPSLPSYGVGVVTSVYREVALALMYAATVVLALVLSANRVPGEVERRTVYNVLARKTARWEYLAGSWLGVWIILGILVLVFLVVDIMMGAIVYKQAMWLLAEGAFAIWLEGGVLAAAAVALSSRLGPVPVTIGGLAFLFVFHSAGSLVGGTSASLARFTPTLDVFSVSDPVAHGVVVPAYDLGFMTVAFLGWVLMLMAIGVLAFNGRDL